MQVSHGVSAVLDDPHLVSAGGLAPVLGLAERAGLHRLVAEHLTVPGSAGANKVVKTPSLMAGMGAGAGGIAPIGLLGHRGMGRLPGGLPGPAPVGHVLPGVD